MTGKQARDWDDDRDGLIEAIYRIVGQVEKRFDSLRETDRDSFTNAITDLHQRLEGFPQQYATRSEMAQANVDIRRLDNEALSRHLYEQNHQKLEDVIAKLDKGTLSQEVFEAFAANYRLELAKAIEDRKLVVDSFSASINQLREQIISERSDFVTQEMYDHQQSLTQQQVASIQAWQYKLVGGLVFATFLAPLVTALIVYVFTKEF